LYAWTSRGKVGNSDIAFPQAPLAATIILVLSALELVFLEPAHSGNTRKLNTITPSVSWQLSCEEQAVGKKGSDEIERETFSSECPHNFWRPPFSDASQRAQSGRYAVAKNTTALTIGHRTQLIFHVLGCDHGVQGAEATD
jgi:hypothetical protein